jgi:hypothetical protein
MIKQFGLNQFGLFKFGQPSHFYIYDTLIKYLPKFIVRNKLCNDIIRAIAVVFVKWQIENQKLLSSRKEYKSGIKYVNEDLQLFLYKDATNDEISNTYLNNFQIHQKRGTLNGIIDDIKRLTNDSKANIKYFNEDQCGWWNGITFPGYDNEGNNNLYYTNCYIDLDKLIEITLENHSGFSDSDLTQIITKEFIPTNISLRLIIVKPDTINFGDYIHHFKLKFRTHKYGEIIK